MKKHIYFVTVVVALGLSGCGRHDDSSSDATQGASSAPAAARALSYEASSGQAGWFRLNTVQSMSLAKTMNRCAIERINGTKAIRGASIQVAAGAPIVFNGWVADPQLQTPQRFLVVLHNRQGAYAHNFTAGGSRPDVAKSLKSEALANSGFRAKSPLVGVPEGDYSVQLLESTAGVFTACPSAARVVVTR